MSKTGVIQFCLDGRIMAHNEVKEKCMLPEHKRCDSENRTMTQFSFLEHVQGIFLLESSRLKNVRTT